MQTKYSEANWFWVQEEPLNMGAASFLKMNLNAFEFKVISRKASAATATGYAKVHAKEQLQLIENAFNI
jgi:2-oxoglutarate dehydrogenase E1 component